MSDDARGSLGEEVTRCRTCLLPENRSFRFGPDGTCRLCDLAARHPSQGPDPRALVAELERKIEDVKRASRARSFDCVVGLSGGRDSTYLLYLLVHKHNLRCLAAYYRTPFTPDATDSNVRRTTARLGVKLVELPISPEEHKRVAREMLLRWLERPTNRVVASMMCAPCKLVNRELYATARANGAAAVICGGNTYEAVQIAPGVSDTAAIGSVAQLTLREQVKRTVSLVRRGAAAVAGAPQLLRHARLGVQAVMYLNPHTPFARLLNRGIQVIEYFYFAPWEQEGCEKALGELGWELPPGCHSSWKSDCTFAEVKNFAFKQMTGMTYVDAFMSNMVRAGALERSAALRRLQEEGVVSEQRLRDVCAVLDISPRAFGLRTEVPPVGERGR